MVLLLIICMIVILVKDQFASIVILLTRDVNAMVLCRSE